MLQKGKPRAGTALTARDLTSALAWGAGIGARLRLNGARCACSVALGWLLPKRRYAPSLILWPLGADCVRNGPQRTVLLAYTQAVERAFRLVR